MKDSWRPDSAAAMTSFAHAHQAAAAAAAASAFLAPMQPPMQLLASTSKAEQRPIPPLPGPPPTFRFVLSSFHSGN